MDDTAQHKNTLELANAEISRGNYEGFLSYCTEDTKWEFIGEQVLEGKELVRQYMAKTYLEPPAFDVEQLVGEGDVVTAIGRIRLKDQTGSMINYSYCDVWTFREGKMHQLKAFVVRTDPITEIDKHANDTVIGSGFTYDEAEEPSDESLPAENVNDQDIVDLPNLGQPNRP